MRKPRDYDAELKALDDKARLLKERKQRHYGELVAATGADGLPLDVLAGALIWAMESADAATKEGWRRRGAAFFRPSRNTAAGAGSSEASSDEEPGGGPSLLGGQSA